MATFVEHLVNMLPLQDFTNFTAFGLLVQPDMIFVKTFTRPEFSGPKFYTKMRKSEKWQIRDITA